MASDLLIDNPQPVTSQMFEYTEPAYKDLTHKWRIHEKSSQQSSHYCPIIDAVIIFIFLIVVIHTLFFGLKINI